MSLLWYNVRITKERNNEKRFYPRTGHEFTHEAQNAVSRIFHKFNFGRCCTGADVLSDTALCCGMGDGHFTDGDVFFHYQRNCRLADAGGGVLSGAGNFRMDGKTQLGELLTDRAYARFFICMHA